MPSLSEYINLSVAAASNFQKPYFPNLYTNFQEKLSISIPNTIPSPPYTTFSLIKASSSALSPLALPLFDLNRINHRIAYAPFVGHKQANNLYFAVFSFQADVKTESNTQYIGRGRRRRRGREGRGR